MKIRVKRSLLLVLGAIASLLLVPAMGLAGPRPAPPGAKPGTPAATDPVPVAPPPVVAVGTVAGIVGPLPQQDPAAIRKLAVAALARLPATAVDDGDTIHVAYVGSVRHRVRYSDGRVVDVGAVQASAGWSATIVSAGIVGKTSWVAMRLVTEYVPPPEPPSPAPAGAVDEFDAVPTPDLAAASIWMLREAKVDKATLCPNHPDLTDEIRPTADAVCARDWPAAAGSLFDPDLLTPKGDTGLGFGSAYVGGNFSGGQQKLAGDLGVHILSASRQQGWTATLRLEFGGGLPLGFSYGLAGFLGAQVGNARHGLAVQGGLSVTGVTESVLPGTLLMSARAQGHTTLGKYDTIAWFEPSWSASSDRRNGSPTLGWADELRAGVWFSGDGDGFRWNGLGLELWETQRARIVQVHIGIATLFSLFR